MNGTILGPLAALGAMGLALGLALLLSDAIPTHDGTAPAWASAVEAGEDHVTPRDLAGLLRDDASRVLVVDVRPPDEFAAFHLPGAINLDLPRLLGAPGEALLDAHGDGLIVLCSNGMTHPAQAWVELVRRGRTNVRVLEDGLDGYLRDVLMPPSLRPFPIAEPEVLDAPRVVSPAFVLRNGPTLFLVDTRDKPEDFAAGHLPGAIHVPTRALRAPRGEVADELLADDALATAFGTLGIDADTPVVAYGGDRLQDPAHFVLALMRLGHQKVAVMEGGLPAWRAQGLALATETGARAPATYLPRAERNVVIATLDEVAAASKDRRATILDVRPAAAFAGENRTEARGGHVPGSINRPYAQDVVVDDTGVSWRSLDELAREYNALGITTDRPVIVSCRTGHQAAQTWFLLRVLLGRTDVRWYDGSWQEWAAHPELPAATGEEKR